MKVWVTKYALTKGILLVSGVSRTGAADAWFLEDKNRKYHPPKSWFPEENFEEAKKKAEAMKEKKIQSLKRQIKKLEALQFTKPEE